MIDNAKNQVCNGPNGQELWWRVCKPAIAGLLDHAGTYSADEKEQQLSFFRRHVAPWLGPPPLLNGSYAVNPIDVASPVEASINFTSSTKPIVRYQYEPLGATKEQQTDPAAKFGQNHVRKMLLQIKEEIRDVHLGWADQFIENLFPNSEAETASVLDRARTELPSPLDHALTFNMALDLSGGKRKMKAYMFPMAKNLATGRHRDARDAGFDAIRNLKPHGDKLAPAVDFLDTYWDTCPEKLVLDMIGMDCVDPSKARIKIYAHVSTRNSWDLVRHVSTFGGQAIDSDRLNGLEILHSIWNILRNESSNPGDDYDKPMRHPTSFLGSIMFSFEIVPGRQIPEVKIYVPMWQYSPSDGHVASNLISAFRKLGWNDLAENYLPNLRLTFPGADLNSPLSVLHSNLSYSYSNATGAYMSVYYAVSGNATIGTSLAE